MYNRWNQSNIQYVENKFISFQEDNHTHTRTLTLSATKILFYMRK